MRKLCYSVLLTFCIALFSQAASAQTKIGHINSAELLSILPEWKAAQKELELYAGKLKQKLQDQEKLLVDEYNRVMDQKQKGLLPPVEEEKKAQEFQQKQADLEQENLKAQQDVSKKEQDLTQPVQQKVITTIETIAKEKGYTYIVDTSIGAFLYTNPADDIMKDVKAKLGIQ